MPELAEVEYYRRSLEVVVGRRIVAVDTPDAWYLKRGLTPGVAVDALVGRRLAGVRRTGKLLLIDLGPPGPGPGGRGTAGRTVAPDVVLGLRFGMTGRLLVDGVPGVRGMLYASEREERAWDRFGLHLDPPADVVVRDPRRLGRVELDPDEDRLGPDALTLTLGQLRRALGKSLVPVKARLLDQARVAGVGNLAADEVLWRAGLDPARTAGELAEAELRRLHRHLRSTMARLLARGGSHTGELQPHRVPGGRCPRDGAPLVRRTIGGRTTWSCPAHQR